MRLVGWRGSVCGEEELHSVLIYSVAQGVWAFPLHTCHYLQDLTETNRNSLYTEQFSASV